MNRNLALNLARVTEAAALQSAHFLGRGDKNAADGAAVDGMRRMFDTLDIEGTVVIGEGEIDEAPMLYIGEQIGKKTEDSVKVEIAVDPLDGTTSLSKGMANAIAVVAIAPQGAFLHAPDTYMEKLAVGPACKGKVDICLPISENLKRAAEALGKPLSDITVSVLDRDRHKELISEIRSTGSRIKLISDGDVLAAIETCFEQSGVDIMAGIGGAPEGVLAAAALKCLGGDFQGRLKPFTEEQKKRALDMGGDLQKVYMLDDLVKSDEVLFAATGVTSGELLKGVVYGKNNTATTQTLVLRNESGTIRFIDAVHRLDKKPGYAKWM